MTTVDRVDEAVRLTGVSAYSVRLADLVVRYGEVVVPGRSERIRQEHDQPGGRR